MQQSAFGPGEPAVLAHITAANAAVLPDGRALRAEGLRHALVLRDEVVAHGRALPCARMHEGRDGVVEVQ